MEVKPVKIFVSSELSGLLPDCLFEWLVSTAFKEVLKKPFYDIWVDRHSKFEYKKAIPVIVGVNRDFALAWENLPQEVKDILLTEINKRLLELVYTHAYIKERYERR